jgi:hypothetical protein
VTGARYVARSTKVAARMVGDEMMIMSGRDSTLFALNATAAALWEAADGVTPLADIVEQRICARFEVDRDTALRDAEEMLGQLAEHGIVTVSDVPILTGATSTTRGTVTQEVGEDR